MKGEGGSAQEPLVLKSFFAAFCHPWRSKEAKRLKMCEVERERKREK